MYEHLRLCDWWAGCPESGGEALPIHRLHLRLRHGPRDWSQPRQASHWSTSLFSRHFFNLAPFLKFSIAANFVYVMAHEIGHNLGMPPLNAFLSLVHFHFFPPFFEFGAYFKISNGANTIRHGPRVQWTDLCQGWATIRAATPATPTASLCRLLAARRVRGSIIRFLHDASFPKMLIVLRLNMNCDSIQNPQFIKLNQ